MLTRRRFVGALGGALLLPPWARAASSIDPFVFYDDFHRANTSDGDIGIPAGKSAYSLLGPYVGFYPLPASLYGRIQSNRFVADANQIVYAQQQFNAPMHQIGGSIIWEDGGGSVTGSTAAFLISTNANTIENIFHCTVSRDEMLLQKRISNGAFVTLGSKLISPDLALNTEYQCIATLQGDNAWFQVGPYTVASGTDSDLSSLPGKWIIGEIYQPNASMIDLVRFMSLWCR